ncbi:hypothetical protein B0H66DRAFT_572695 [Apodospora peruviana]|uniref:Amidoligase enzyme-domain-containing protein n=1 Tax=Apodospora peruviana TaxID=516989 RepID=A0AAE0MGD0_9PEZI|nr:hypothetical protein B0H66DRAFT_572695 [Apodospora peruviana]
MAPFLFDEPAQHGPWSEEQEDTFNKMHTPTSTSLDAVSNRSRLADATTGAGKDSLYQVDTVDDISFGLELKCLIPLLIAGEQNPGPKDTRETIETSSESNGQARQDHAYACIAKTIREAGYDATTTSEISKAGLEERNCWESCWIVKKANSAEPTEEQRALKGHVWVPVEICSPKLRANDPDTYARVQRVMKLLVDKHGLVANYTCDIHVHLGRMDGRPFLLPTLKRLAMLLWLAEPTLRMIRDPKSPNYHNVYTWGAEIRRHSRLATGEPSCQDNGQHQEFKDDDEVTNLLTTYKSVPPKDQNALGTIWTSPSYHDLGRLLSGETKQYRRLGFNFSAFGEEDDRAKSNPRTVEFRIMEGSTQSDLVAIADAAVVRRSETESSGHQGGDGNMFGSSVGRLLRLSSRTEGEEASLTGQDFGRQFGELMQDLGLSREDYQALEEKIVQEN